MLCYVLKANTNKTIITLYASLDIGANIVNGRKIYRALEASVDPKNIIHSGIDKTKLKINFAFKTDILIFNLNTPQKEPIALNQIATRLKIKEVPISIRINPNAYANPFPYITTSLIKKNVTDLDSALKQYQIATKLPYIIIKDTSCYIGNQIIEFESFI